MKKSLLALIILLSCICDSFGQEFSPGGVGSTNLWVWTKADSITGSSSNISAWPNKSKKTGAPSFSLASGTTSPTIRSNAINGNPTIVFNGSGYFTTTTSVTGVTECFVVGKLGTTNGTSITNTTGAMVGSQEGDITHGYFFHTENARLYVGTSANDNYFYTTQYVNSNSSQYNATPYLLCNADVSEANGSQAIKLNGTAYPEGSAANPYMPSSLTLRLGARGAQPLISGGEIAEIIVLSASQSGTNRQKIQSYLALKYGITLTPGVATNYLASDGTIYWTGNATYQNNITGIGYDKQTALNQKQSTSVGVNSTQPYSNTSGVLTVGLGNKIYTSQSSNPLSFPSSDKTYFVVGDNNGSITTYGNNITTSINGSNATIKKINRTWLINKTNWTDTYSNPNGYISLKLDATKITTKPTYIVISSGADIMSNTVAYPLTYANDSAYVAVPNYDLKNNYYFSFATNSTTIALPVQYTKELAAQQVSNNTNELTWTTSTEINNKGFDIQRSSNTKTDWLTIGNVPSYFTSGTGNGHSYKYIDYSPLYGNNNYRLMQIDLDGKASYSKIVNVYNSQKSEIKLFPNPVKDKFTISNILNGSAIKIYNLSGILLKTLINSGSTIEINVSDLPSGMYIVKIINTDKTSSQVKFIKK